MPVILPTPDELVALDWHKRDKAIRAARALLRGYGAHVEPADGTRYRLRKAAKERAWGQWAEEVRAEARRIEATR